MGLGLVMNNNNSYGKWSALNTLFTQTSTLRAHTTRSSSNYLQGAAITLDMGRGWEATAFASYRKLDATLNNDDGSIATILSTDYHRTETEMNKKNNVAETDLGAHVGWREHGFHSGRDSIPAASRNTRIASTLSFPYVSRTVVRSFRALRFRP